MQQFKRTLLRIFMMLFLVAGVSTFMVMNANAVFADELDASDDTKVEVNVDAAVNEATEVVEPDLLAGEASDVAEDLANASETDSDEGEDANKEVLPDAEVEAADDNETGTEEVALETTPAEESTETDTEEEAIAVKHLTVYGGVNYEAVYDFVYYQDHNADIKNAFKDDDTATLAHFINFGMKEQRQAIVTFDEVSYRLANVDLRLAFGSDYAKYYLHYINYGQYEKRDAIGVEEVRNPVTEYKGVDYAKVYNYEDYQKKYADIQKAFGNDDVATLAHFVTFGMKEERQGSENFDEVSYRRAYPDLRAAFGTNYPSYYLHYMKYGNSEGRDQTKGITDLVGYVTKYDNVDYALVYDFNYYQKHYDDIKAAFGDDDTATLLHFINYGMNEQRRGSENFDEVSYRRAYADLRRAFGKKYAQYYLHYINIGSTEGRKLTKDVTYLHDAITTFGNLDLSSIYDYQYYTDTYKDIAKAYGEDDSAVLEHFVKYGLLEGRRGKEKASYDQTEYNDKKSIAQKFANASTQYAGLELSMIYDFYYYYKNGSDLWDTYGTDTDSYIKHFATDEKGIRSGRKGTSSYRTDVYNMFKDTFTRYANGDSSYVIMDQLAQKYTSSTKYLVTISYTDHRVNIYEHVVSGVWTKTKCWQCSMGASATPTPTGQFTISDRCYYFDSGYSRCFYATRVNGSIMMHSVLYYQNPGPTQVMDGTLGANVSHGCIRMPLDGCKWVYNNIPAGTKCAIYYR